MMREITVLPVIFTSTFISSVNALDINKLTFA